MGAVVYLVFSWWQQRRVVIAHAGPSFDPAQPDLEDQDDPNRLDVWGGLFGRGNRRAPFGRTGKKRRDLTKAWQYSFLVRLTSTLTGCATSDDPVGAIPAFLHIAAFCSLWHKIPNASDAWQMVPRFWSMFIYFRWATVVFVDGNFLGTTRGWARGPLGFLRRTVIPNIPSTSLAVEACADEPMPGTWTWRWFSSGGAYPWAFTLSCAALASVELYIKSCYWQTSRLRLGRPIIDTIHTMQILGMNLQGVCALSVKTRLVHIMRGRRDTLVTKVSDLRNSFRLFGEPDFDTAYDALRVHIKELGYGDQGATAAQTRRNSRTALQPLLKGHMEMMETALERVVAPLLLSSLAGCFNGPSGLWQFVLGFFKRPDNKAELEPIMNHRQRWRPYELLRWFLAYLLFSFIHKSLRASKNHVASALDDAALQLSELRVGLPITGPDSRSREAEMRERRLHSLQDLATFTSTSLRTNTHKFRFDLFGVSYSAYKVGRSVGPFMVLMVLARTNVQ